MELPPPRHTAYRSHSPKDLHLPSVPQTELSQPHVQAEITLPNLRTVLSPEFEQASLPPRYAASDATRDSRGSVRSLPPMDPGNSYTPHKSIEQAVASPSEAGSVMSIEDKSARSRSAVSMDDSDVRIAASALAELGNPDFARSPQHASVSHVIRSDSRHPNDPEPILKLFTKAHPWVGGTINGSLSAYSTTKNFSPGFVQNGANAIERNIGAPVANAVASVGRITGVESGLRWYYGGNAEMQDRMDGAPNKRRRADDEMDLEGGVSSRARRESQDSLPPYGTSKPPSYREETSPSGGARQRPAHSRSFSNQVIVTTSSLGVALSTTSRRSLRSCLQLLEGGAQRTSIYMNALSMVLEQYDEARVSYHERQSNLEKGGENERPQTPDHDEAARRLAAIIKQHSDDIWQTIQTVVSSVSNSAGAALPDNVRVFVRNQLMSLPQRWKWVSEHSGGLESETSRSAHRMVAFAKEGLDMMGQVSEAFRVTLVGAEQWLERAGRRDPEAGMYGGDVKTAEMGGVVQQQQQQQHLHQQGLAGREGR